MARSTFYYSRWLPVGLAGVVVGACFGCKSPTAVSTKTISVRHTLPTNFSAAVQSTLKVVQTYLDEIPGQPSLFSTTSQSTGQTTDGYSYIALIDDFDGDATTYEFGLTVSENVFGVAREWTLSIAGNPLANGFHVVGRLYRRDAGVDELVATARAEATADDAGIQFGGGEKLVVLNYTCASGVSCLTAGADAGADGGGGAGGDAAADVTPPVSSVSVVADASVVAGDAIAVTVTASDVGVGLRTVEISYNSGETWEAIPNFASPWSGSFTASRFRHVVVTRATDDAGNVETPDGGPAFYTMKAFASDLLGQGTEPTNFDAGCVAGAGRTGLYSPHVVYADSANRHLFVSDTTNHRILVFNMASGGAFDSNADYVLGQPDFVTCANPGTPTAANLDFAKGLAFDSTNNQLFVADTNRNRILVFDLSNGVSNGMSARYVFGQTSFTTATSATTQSSLSAPNALAFRDSDKRLFIADRNNNRVVVYLLTSITNGQNAEKVLGQPDFTSSSSGTDAGRMYLPSGLALDTAGNRLFVADEFNNRVTVFDVATISSFEPAYGVIGQTSFFNRATATTQSGMSSPVGVAYNSTLKYLYVVESGNSRVTIWDANYLDAGESAKYVLGKENFTTSGQATTQDGLALPLAVHFDQTDNRLFVSEANNNRVTIWDFDTIAYVNGTNATGAIGHYSIDGGAVYDSNCAGGGNAAGFNQPYDVAVDAVNNRLFVVESNSHRVLVFSLDPNNRFDGGRAANYVLGQDDFAHCTPPGTATQGSFYSPRSIAYDSVGQRLFVGDWGNSRVMVFGAAPGVMANKLSASVALGQSSWSGASTSLSATGLSTPGDLVYDADAGRLFVADTGNNRVLVFSNAGLLSMGQAAAYVIGQTLFDAGASGSSANRLSGPAGVVFDPVANRLWVSDTNNSRVLGYDVATLATGMNATVALGQSDLDGSVGGFSATKLYGPRQLALDVARRRLYVTDNFNNRVLAFDVSSPTTGMPAFNVIGQGSFTGTVPALSQQMFSSPQGIDVDPSGRFLYLADLDNNRVLLFDLGP